MKTYYLNQFIPSWHFDPATVRQMKVLRFFGLPIEPPPTKGVASGLIGRLFSDAANKHLWAAYVYTTGDEESTSIELCPLDREALAKVVIPEDWHPKRGPTIKRADRKVLEELISGLLKEGSPFDDPLPEISIQGKSFCFTGAFDYGFAERLPPSSRLSRRFVHRGCYVKDRCSRDRARCEPCLVTRELRQQDRSSDGLPDAEGQTSHHSRGILERAFTAKACLVSKKKK